MEPAAVRAAPDVTWHGAVTDFKRRLLEQALRSAGGNRTHAARALGLQRTYLLRLIRDLGVAVPPARREAAKAGGRGRVRVSAGPPSAHGEVREEARPDRKLDGERHVSSPISTSVAG
jgi:hypothetical protein